MMLWNLGALWTRGGTAHLARVSCYLEGTNNLLRAHLWFANQPVLSPYPPSAFFFQAPAVQDHYPSVLITSWPGTRQLGTIPVAQSPMTSFKLSNLTVSHPLLPAKTTITTMDLAPAWLSPCSFCLLTEPAASRHGPACCGMVPPLGDYA